MKPLRYKAKSEVVVDEAARSVDAARERYEASFSQIVVGREQIAVVKVQIGAIEVFEGDGRNGETEQGDRR